MALTTIDTNNKLIKFTQDINREFVRENMFSPYMGEEMTSIIRVRNELKAGGETINMPIVTRLRNAPVGSGTLVGAEEKIDNYGQRVRVDWARNAVVTNKAESQKDSADIFGEAKPLLSDWGKELQRDELIASMMAVPTETPPGTDVRVNGILYQSATTIQRSTWQLDNYDRILFGEKLSNNTNLTGPAAAGDHAASLLTVGPTNGKFTAANLSLLKRLCMNADPKIRPYKTRDGYEYYVAFAGINPFRDLKIDLQTVNKDARPREQMGQNGAPNNPIFQDGDQIYDGVIVRAVPEISLFVSNIWTTLKTAGVGSARVEPVFICGQQAAAMCWGQMAKPTFRKEDDYGFITGTGIEMCYGASKIFKKHTRQPGVGPATPSANPLIQFGMGVGFFASSADV